jgi:hypothetical protein
VNHTIGNFNKVDNKKTYTMISTDEKEALRFKKDFGCPYIKVDEFFINTLENKTQLTEGFRLISLLIYDSSHKQLLDLKEELVNNGVRVYGCNTDALYVENCKKLNDYKTKNKKNFEFKNKADFDAIGKIKVKLHDKPYVSGELKRFNQMNVYDTIKYIPPPNKNIEITDEWNVDEIISKIENKTIITALCAGAGKTYTLCNYAKSKKTLFITPYNALCFALQKNGLTAITRDKLMGEIFDGNSNIHREPYNVSDYEAIVFDEIFLYRVEDLQKINRYMLSHKHITFLATGDGFQNKPICENNSSVNYEQIIMSMFPNNVLLRKNKRGKTESDRQQFENLSYDVRNMKDKKEFINIVKKYKLKVIHQMSEITSKRNISHLNSTCDKVNYIIQKKTHPKSKYYEGLNLLCKKSYIYKSLRLFVNFTYKIEMIDKDYLLLNDGEKNVSVSREIIESHFKLPYSQTCYSLQGLDIDEPFTIFDINNYFVNINWIYTAITRATEIQNIQIYFGEISDNDIDSKINSMISSHRKSDSKRKMPMTNYIDLKWAIKELKNTSVCYYCKDELNDDNFSIDRKDNNLNHVKENCRIICFTCNVSKK